MSHVPLLMCHIMLQALCFIYGLGKEGVLQILRRSVISSFTHVQEDKDNGSIAREQGIASICC